jgi:predicted ester cyclase
MTIEQNKAIADRLPLELNKGNMGVLDEVTDPRAVDHSLPPGMPPTVESTKQFLTMFRTAFPDLTYTVEFSVAEGDKVMQRVTARGTMKSDFMGMKATGKSATWTESHIVRITNGKVVEHWANLDQVGMLQQLGLMPGA